MKGQVLKWGRAPFGFITRDDGEGDVFVHESDLPEVFRDGVIEGMRVSFELGEHNGRSCAKSVQVIG